MSTERVDAYAEALLGIARAEGHVEEIEDELFRFARAVEGNDALRSALVDRGLPAERRFAVAAALFALATIPTALVSGYLPYLVATTVAGFGIALVTTSMTRRVWTSRTVVAR